MERKEETHDKGICGVVADIIHVEKKYEVAIETALGGNIQNIVTEDENTAKNMIEYLKRRIVWDVRHSFRLPRLPNRRNSRIPNA